MKIYKTTQSLYLDIIIKKLYKIWLLQISIETWDEQLIVQHAQSDAMNNDEKYFLCLKNLNNQRYDIMISQEKVKI